MPLAPTRFEISLRDCYAGMKYSMDIHDNPRALQFARAIVKHARTERVPAKWLMNALAVVRAFGEGEERE